MCLVARRIRREFGVYRAEQWPLFLHDHGMLYLETDEAIPIECYRWRNVIVIAAGIPRWRRAYLVWHELSHGLIHAGDQDWWITRPQGNITVAKFERQADVFAALYPIWERGVLDEVLHYYGVELPTHSRRVWR